MSIARGLQARLRGAALRAAARWAPAVGLLAIATACSGRSPDGVASAEPPASATAAPSASAASAVPVAPPPPTLRPVPAHEGEAARGADFAEGVRLFTVPGAVLLSTWDRVGRVTTERIEWKGNLGMHVTALGRGMIQWVGGLYPDAIDLTYSMENGRAAQPTYQPLTGKGHSVTFSPGGGMAWIYGVARVGESVLVSGYDMYDGHKVAGVRGPALTRLSVPWALRCKGDPPMAGITGKGNAVAVRPADFAASRAGTLFSTGLLCDEDPAVEIWPKEGGQPKILELSSLQRKPGGALLVGREDEVWLTGDPILVWRGDRFEALPSPPHPPRRHVVSTAGDLHVLDGTAIHRWDGRAWIEIARTRWPADFDDVAVDGETVWVTIAGKLHRLERTDPVPSGEACTSPFVFLYDVSHLSEPKYTFPTTRKALSTFDRREGVQLVDFQAGRRRLGAVVPSWEVGEALVAHVQQTMKDEHPRLVCFAPEAPRVIPIDGK